MNQRFDFQGRKVEAGYDWRTLDLSTINYHREGVSDADIREQLRLEEKALLDGAAAFRRRMEKAIGRGDAGAVGGYRKVIEALLEPTAAALRVIMSDQYAKRAQRRQTVWRMLPPGLDANQLAYLTIKVALGSMIKGSTRLQRLAEEVGRAVEIEATVIKFLNESGDAEAAFVKRLQSTTSNMRHIRGAILSVMSKKDMEPIGWTNHECVLVGTNLLEAARAATGFIEQLNIRRSAGFGRFREEVSLSLRPEIQEWALDQSFLDEITKPERTPMVVPPRPWTSLRGGGYLGVGNLRKRMLIRPRDKEHAHLLNQSIREGKVEAVFSAVNRVQDTAWRINTDILHLVQEMYDKGQEWAGLVSSADPEFPPKPHDIETCELSRTEWKKQTAAVWAEKAERSTKRFETVTKLRIAAEYKDYPRIYFPHEMDFRGRLYPSAVGLQPQGDDLSKALLLFAEGKSLSSAKAEEWFYIHGANVFGKDKVSFTERIKWVMANQEMIRRCAADPLTNREWADADNPFQFLAWCKEFDDWLKYGYDFRSHIPIALDGTCNGIQHFSAMVRDEVSGASVNLTPSEEPQDIYGAVADKAMDLIAHDDELDQGIADGILSFGIDRSMAKPAVMVLPYGGRTPTFYNGIINKLREAIRKHDADRVWPWPETSDESRVAMVAVARSVVKAMREEVASGTQVLTWLQTLVRLSSSKVVPRWVTPDGLVLSARYQEEARVAVGTTFNGRVQLWSLNAPDESCKTNTQRMETATPPNFVHSLDACALRMTVNSLPSNTSLAMIHDSYGTHAADTAALAAALRTAFVTMYETHDPLRELYEDTQRRLGTDVVLPEPPARGTLDLKQVLSSEYFFA